MRHYALTAVGRDQPGIVARVSHVLLGHGVNVEDSQMTILRGHFTMMLVVTTSDDADVESLRDDLTEAGHELSLEALLLSEVAELDPDAEPMPSLMVTVYGADHPGILHAVTAAMAAHEVDITDLNTRLLSSESEPIYALMMEVALPEGLETATLEAELAEVSGEQGVEVSVKPLEVEAL